MKSIKTKNLIFITFTLALTIVAFLITTFWSLDNSNTQSIKKNVFRIEQILETILKSEKNKLIGQSELIGALPILNAVVNTKNGETIKDSAREYMEEIGVDIFNIFTTDGSLLASVGDPFEDISEQEFNALINSVTSGKTISLFAVYSNKVALLTLVPVGVKSDPSGYLMAGKFLNNKMLADIKQMTDTDLTLFIDGKVTSSTSDLEAVKSIKDSLSPYLNQTTLSTDENGLIEVAKSYFKLYPLLSQVDQRPLGTVTIQFSNEELNKTKNTILKIVGAISLAIALLVFILAYYSSKNIAGPIQTLAEHMEQIIKNKKLQEQETPSDLIEIKMLNDSFNHLISDIKDKQIKLEEYNQKLEQKVEERTAQLREAQENISTILNNLGDVFMMVDKNANIIEVSKNSAEAVLQKSSFDEGFIDLISNSEKEKNDYSKWLGFIFSGAMPFKDLKGLGPKTYTKIEDKYIELDYKPVFDSRDNKTIKNVICIASDKSTENELRQKLEQDKKRIEMIISILKNQFEFGEFLEILKLFLSSFKDHTSMPVNKINIDSLLRDVHTIKGLSATFYIDELEKSIHDLETILIRVKSDFSSQNVYNDIEEHKIKIDGILKNFLDKNNYILGNARTKSEKPIAKESINEMERILEVNLGRDSQLYKAFLEKFVLDPFSKGFEKFEHIVETSAQKLSKAVSLKINEDQSRVRLSKYEPFLNSLVHVFRNSIDHGIESANQRKALGKSANGTIIVDFKEIPEGKISITISDDGSGINLEKVVNIAIEKGLITEDDLKRMNVNQKLKLVFHPGFSTKQEVSMFSGRGVGLDAVEYEVKELGGEILVSSTQGEGTKFTFTVPKLT